MKKLMLTLFTISMLAACRNNVGNQEQTTQKQPESGIESISNSDKVKSVYYEAVTEMPGGMGSSNSKIFTDDFGNKMKMTVESNMSYAGKSINSESYILMTDGYSYSWSNKAKTGLKVKIDKKNFDPNTSDITNMSEEMKKKFNIKNEGTEEVNGKNCVVFSYSLENVKGKMWNWKGVPVKMEINMMDKVITTNVTNIQENPSIPSGTFEVPNDITFTEMNTTASE